MKCEEAVRLKQRAADRALDIQTMKHRPKGNWQGPFRQRATGVEFRNKSGVSERRAFT